MGAVDYWLLGLALPGIIGFSRRDSGFTRLHHDHAPNRRHHRSKLAKVR
jgi:hypothetical protein